MTVNVARGELIRDNLKMAGIGFGSVAKISALKVFFAGATSGSPSTMEGGSGELPDNGLSWIKHAAFPALPLRTTHVVSGGETHLSRTLEV